MQSYWLWVILHTRLQIRYNCWRSGRVFWFQFSLCRWRRWNVGSTRWLSHLLEHKLRRTMCPLKRWQSASGGTGRRPRWGPAGLRSSGGGCRGKKGLPVQAWYAGRDEAAMLEKAPRALSSFLHCLRAQGYVDFLLAFSSLCLGNAVEE